MTAVQDTIQRQSHTDRVQAIGNQAREDRSYRYERKFLVENARLQAVQGVVHLHPAVFHSIYAPRFINNVYLDTPCFRNYRNALDGVANRLKARIRWYGDLTSTVCTPQLEIKGKTGNVSYKSVYPLKDFEILRRIDAGAISMLLDASELPSEIRSYLTFTSPVLINRYRRKYWRSRDARYRLTIDHGVWFGRFTAFESQELSRGVENTDVILEIKYQLADDTSFADISNKLPFRQTRSSKYVAGMDHIYQLGNYY